MKLWSLCIFVGVANAWSYDTVPAPIKHYIYIPGISNIGQQIIVPPTKSYLPQFPLLNNYQYPSYRAASFPAVALPTSQQTPSPCSSSSAKSDRRPLDFPTPTGSNNNAIPSKYTPYRPNSLQSGFNWDNSERVALNSAYGFSDPKNVVKPRIYSMLRPSYNSPNSADAKELTSEKSKSRNIAKYYIRYVPFPDAEDNDEGRGNM